MNHHVHPFSFFSLKRFGRLILSIFIIHGGVYPFCQKTSASQTEPAIEIQRSQNKMSIDITNGSIGDFIRQAWTSSGIKIEGLETRETEHFSFRIQKTSVEHALKALLKHLDETSYAFEYRGEILTRVSVVKESKKRGSDLDLLAGADKSSGDEGSSMNMEGNAPGRFFKNPIMNDMMRRNLPAIFDQEETETHSAEPSLEEMEEEMESRPSAVKVMNVIGASQAEKAGVREGDIIHVYDGVRIESPDMLIREVQNKQHKENVTITVFRNGEPINFEIQGGFIGVSIAPSVMPEQP